MSSGGGKRGGGWERAKGGDGKVFVKIVYKKEVRRYSIRGVCVRAQLYVFVLAANTETSRRAACTRANGARGVHCAGRSGSMALLVHHDNQEVRSSLKSPTWLEGLTRHAPWSG